MGHCITLALGIICSSGTPLTPTEAASVLAPHQFVYVPPRQSPQVVVIERQTQTEPRHDWRSDYGRRLDGTPLWMPPTVYGLPYYGGGFRGGCAPPYGPFYDAARQCSGVGHDHGGPRPIGRAQVSRR